MNSRLLVLAAAFALASCTGDPAPSTPQAPKTYADPVEWANAYCSGTLTANNVGQELMAQSQNWADPAGVRAALVKVYAAAAAAQTESARRLEELGPPGADAEDAHRSLVQLVRESGEYSSKLEAGLRGLEPDADFRADVEKLVGSIFDVSSVERSKAAIDKLSSNPAYINALHNAPVCVEMREKAMVNPPR